MSKAVNTSGFAFEFVTVKHIPGFVQVMEVVEVEVVAVMTID